MAVETNPSSPSEMSRRALRLPVRQQQRRGAAKSETGVCEGRDFHDAGRPTNKTP